MDEQTAAAHQQGDDDATDDATDEVTGKRPDDISATRTGTSRISRRGLLIAGGAVVAAAGGAATALWASGDDSPEPGGDSAPPGFPAHPKVRHVATLKGHKGTIETMRFSPDGRMLVSSEADAGNARLWDVRTHKQLGTPLTSDSVVFRSVALSRDGKTLVTGGADRAEFWQVPSLRRSGRPLPMRDDTQNSFEVVAISPDGRTLATGGSGDLSVKAAEEVPLWDVTSRRRRGDALTGHEGGVDGLLFSPDGKTLAAGSNFHDGVVRLWDVASRRQRGGALTGHEGGVSSMAFSPDSRTLATSSGVVPGFVRFWDVATGKQRGKPLRCGTFGVPGLAYSGDGKAIVTFGFYSGPPRMRFWDAATHRERAKPPAMGVLALPVAFTADGLTLATGGQEDNAIRLWRIE